MVFQLRFAALAAGSARLIAAAGALAAVALLAGCGTRKNAWSGVYEGGEDAALPSPAEPTPRDVLAQAAIDLEAAFAAHQDAPAPTLEPASAPPAPEAPETGPISAADTAVPTVTVLESPEPDLAAALAPEPAPDPDVVAADLAGRIAQVLGSDLRPEEEPLRQAVRLLALEMVSPGSASPELRALEEAMLPPQQEALAALRSLFQELTDNSTLDQPRLADLLERQIEALPRGRPLGIAEMALCTSVEGFGRYTPMPATFAAGQAHAVLVYVEVENFRQRRFDSAKDGWSGYKDPTAERWVAELGQEVALLDDRNDHVALHEAEQVVRDIARRRRRDFYIVQRIDLPAQLAIGKYHLKVTVRDLVDGAAVAERIIPIEIAAQ